jgi:hypothetical protein
VASTYYRSDPGSRFGGQVGNPATGRTVPGCSHAQQLPASRGVTRGGVRLGHTADVMVAGTLLSSDDPRLLVGDGSGGAFAPRRLPAGCRQIADAGRRDAGRLDCRTLSTSPAVDAAARRLFAPPTAAVATDLSSLIVIDIPGASRTDASLESGACE